MRQGRLFLAQKSREGEQAVKLRILCAINCSMLQQTIPNMVEVRNRILPLTPQNWKNGAIQLIQTLKQLPYYVISEKEMLLGI